MNLRAVISVGAFAVVGLMLRVTPGVSESPQKPPPAKTEPRETKPKGGAEKPPSPPVGPWTSTCRYFGKKPDAQKAEGASLYVKAKDELRHPIKYAEQYRETFCIPTSGPEIDTVVASIPDPTGTNLGYFADRSLESLTRAFAVSGWNFDSAHMPWIDPGAANGKWLERSPADEEPGVVIYRRDDKLRLVFLVGEAPSSGLNTRVLRKAFYYSLALANPSACKGRLIGPAFSGSATSLVRVVQEMTNLLSDFELNAYSGTLSGATAVGELSKVPKLHFFTTSESSQQSEAWLQQTIDLLGIQKNEVTILVEGDTGFGADYLRGKVTDGFRKLPFPKDISNLRNTYRETGLGSTPPGGLQPNLPLSFRDGAGGGDSFPVLAQTVTTQTQYAALRGIVEDLRRDTKLVEVVATNVLDSLFLASLIEDGAPETRVLIPEADVLFIRAAQEQGQRGVLAFVPEAGFRFGRQWREHGSLASSSAAGQYDAALLLDSRDARPSQTPVWLAEVSRTGYMPIQQLGDGVCKPARADMTALTVPAPGYLWWVLAGGTALLGIAAVVGLWGAVIKHEWRLFALFAKPPAEPFREHWEAVTQVTLFCLIAMALMVVLPIAGAQGVPWGALPGLVAIGGLFSAYYLAPNWRGILLGILILGPWLVVEREYPQESRLLAIRMIEIASGTSPTIPLFLLLGGLCLGGVIHLRRISLAFERNPGIPAGGSASVSSERLAMAWNQACAMWNTGGAPGTPGWVAGLVTFLTAVFAWAAWRHVMGVGGPLWTATILAPSVALLVSLLWSAGLFYWNWQRLRYFLQELDGLPMDGSFHRIPPNLSSAPIWKGSPNRRNFDVFLRCTECLRELTLAPNLGENRRKAVRDHLQILEEKVTYIKNCDVAGIVEDYEELSQRAREAAEYLFRSFLVPAWSGGELDPVPESSDKPPQPEYRLAAEFVALRYSSAIRYAMMQLRNLMWFLSGGFLLFALALDSADTQSPELIRWFLAVVFLVIGYLTISPLFEMEKNRVLQRMTTPETGERNMDVYFKLASYGAAPLLAMVSSFFPSVSRFLFSWLQPTLETLK